VENAIRHGIEPREDPGHLAISARRNNGRLELRVADNGAGLGGSGAAQPKEGIGLSNTRSRLRHLYGEDFRFELTEGGNGGLEALIEIPYHLKPAHGL
jgi:sensor histidine kinase YesM